jgi:hypothetical protein
MLTATHHVSRRRSALVWQWVHLRAMVWFLSDTTSRHPINVCTRRVAYHHSEWIIADGVGCKTDDADTMFHLAVEQIMYV